MTYLILFILLSVIIYAIFKLFTSYDVHTFQAILVNYLLCAIIGVGMIGFQETTTQVSLIKPVLPYAISLGFLFIMVFTLIAKTAQKFGLGTASISDKLSFVIPVIVAFMLYGDSVTAIKIIGILLAVLSIYFSTKKSDKKQQSNNAFWYYPVLVFVGSGLIGSLLNHVQKTITDVHPEINYNTFLIFLFGVAFCFGLLYAIYLSFQGKFQVKGKNIIAGIALGIPNYFSMYTLLHAFETSGLESSLVFPIMNIGIVVLSALVGIIAFKEASSRTNQLGLALAVISIVLLILGN